MKNESSADAGVEQPVLWLGMAGFAPRERSALEACLNRSDGLPRWRPGAFGDADAWWVNGAKARALPDGKLKVSPGLPTERTLNLDLEEVDRPVAFALPLAGDDFEPRCTFDPASEPSIAAALSQFDRWLWLVRAQFVLGAQLIERSAQLRRGVYHVSHAGQLLAVLDFLQGKAAVLPGVHPVDLWEAEWSKRPIGAHDLPQSFVPVTPAQLTWTYVRRTERDMLPPRYRTQTIYYRHVPGVPLRWLADSQLMILRELSAEPAAIDALRQRTGLPQATIEHDLSCLYYAYAITTTPGKAAPAAAGAAESQPHSVGSGFESMPRSGASSKPTDDDLTAPALLEHKRRFQPKDPT